MGEVEMRPRGDPRTLERRRLKAVELFREGIGPGMIATRLGVDRRSVHRWLSSFHSRGVQGLAPSPTPGRPCKLSLEDRQRLADMLVGGAMAHGYPSDRWTNSRVVDLIRRRFGITYHPHHVSRFLHSLDAARFPIRERGLPKPRKKC